MSVFTGRSGRSRCARRRVRPGRGKNVEPGLNASGLRTFAEDAEWEVLPPAFVMTLRSGTGGKGGSPPVEGGGSSRPMRPTIEAIETAIDQLSLACSARRVRRRLQSNPRIIGTISLEPRERRAEDAADHTGAA
jgi:hypothetical protein